MKIEKKDLRDNIEQLISEGIINGEEIDVTTDKVIKLIWIVIDYLQTRGKNNVALSDGASISESQIKEIGFQLTDSYNHDHYHTNRYKKGCLQVEFTYGNDELLTCDLTISEVNCMPVTIDQMKALTLILGEWEE